MSARILLKTLCAPVVVFFFVSTFLFSPPGICAENNEKCHGWLPGWNYRKKITISNPGPELKDYHVLITLDTATLISAGKMRADCGDLRVTDSDGGTNLEYWIEGGHNTRSTQIWLLIRKIPHGSKPIYVYYGNDSATSRSLTWNGSFIVATTTAPQSNWNLFTALVGRFPRGAASYGNTGGSPTHIHTYSGITSSATGNSVNKGAISGVGGGAHINHRHDYSGMTKSAENLPPYMDLIYCNSTSLIIEQNFIACFDTASLPSGWTRFTALDGRFPRGATSYGTTGGSTTHNHTIIGVTDGPTKTTDTGIVSQSGASDGHIHRYQGRTSSAEHIPPYLDVVYGIASSGARVNNHTILMFTALPPLGWTRFTALDGRFPRGAAESGASGGAATHNHTYDIIAEVSSNTASTGIDSKELAYKDHTHTLTGITSSEEHLPPYLDVIFGIRNTVTVTAVVETEQSPPEKPRLLAPKNYGYISTPRPSFQLSATDAEGDSLQYKIELSTDNFVTILKVWTPENTGWSASSYPSGAVATYTVQPGDELPTGKRYQWRAYAIDPGGSGTWSIASEGGTFVIDTTAPVPPAAVRDGLSDDVNFTSTIELAANWDEAYDGESGIMRYWYAIGTAPGATDIAGWTDNGLSRNVKRSDLALTTGRTYYFAVKAENGAGLQSPATSSDGCMVDTTPPFAPPEVRDGPDADIDFTTLSTELSANWDAAYDAESGIVKYWYAIGTMAGGNDVVDWTDNGLSTNVTRTDLRLVTGRTYYFTVKAENGAGLRSSATSSDGCRFSEHLPMTLRVAVNTTISNVSSGQKITVLVHVTSDAQPVAGAMVSLNSNISIMFSPENGTTDQNGDFVFTFTAPTVAKITWCAIEIKARKTGFIEGNNTLRLKIIPISAPSNAQPQPSHLVIVLLFAILLCFMLGVWYFTRRKRVRPAFKPVYDETKTVLVYGDTVLEEIYSLSPDAETPTVIMPCDTRLGFMDVCGYCGKKFVSGDEKIVCKCTACYHSACAKILGFCPICDKIFALQKFYKNYSST